MYSLALQALGFHIWVAELELLVGHARNLRQNVDPVASVELLQKLLVTMDSSQKERIREYQRRCDDALADILLRGTAPPVSGIRENPDIGLICYSATEKT